jgi:hypothetical protein
MKHIVLTLWHHLQNEIKLLRLEPGFDGPKISMTLIAVVAVAICCWAVFVSVRRVFTLDRS